MKTPIVFFVQGKPQPAGSKRAFVIKKGGAYTGRAIVTDANPKARDWKIDVQAAAIESERMKGFSGPPWECAIALSLEFTILRPKSHYGTGKNAGLLKPDAPLHPVSKPDTTKLCRGVEDALTGILWKDDAQIVRQVITKSYGHCQGVKVEVNER